MGVKFQPGVVFRIAAKFDLLIVDLIMGVTVGAARIGAPGGCLGCDGKRKCEAQSMAKHAENQLRILKHGKYLMQRKCSSN